MRSKLIAAFLLLGNMLCAQASCEVWQWKGMDSSSKILAKTQKFNSNGLVIYEKESGIQTDPHFSGFDCENFYVYSDTLLMSQLTAMADKDSFKVEFIYDSLGRFLVSKAYTRRYVITDTVQSGMFTIDMVETDPDHGKWNLSAETRSIYDRWGRLVLTESTYGKSLQKHVFMMTYDTNGLIVKLEYLYGDKPRYTDDITHYSNGRRRVRTHYDDNGKAIKKAGKNAPIYQQHQVYIFTTDSQGREIEERVEDRKGKLIERLVTAYNSQGKIAREVWYDGKGEVEMVHDYVYK
jgi:hypothetical protein